MSTKSTNKVCKLIAITGKGGEGNPVLAIDADPNSCLDAALGVRVTETVGRAREEAKVSSVTGANISKRELLRIKLEQALVEANGFDLIAMGRPEGEGCYCYANSVLKEIIAEISSQYPYVVLDNEAGLENLSRRIVQKVDLLILASDASNAGLQTLVRLHELAVEMALSYSKLALVVNRLRTDKLPSRMDEIREKTKADLVIGLPDDEEVTAFAETSRSFLEISDSNPVYKKPGN